RQGRLFVDARLVLGNLRLVERILGSNPGRTVPFILSSNEEETGALFATNHYSIDFSNRTAFFAASETLSSFSARRREFIGKAGTIQAPQSV
ncbi:hypothetical protein ACC785_37170, partial [Rhizobium ruizarguesonis]